MPKITGRLSPCAVWSQWAEARQNPLPPDIEALLPRGLRNILDPPLPAPPSAAHTHAETSTTHEEDNEEGNARGKGTGGCYRDECRGLAGKPGYGTEYRHLFGDVVEKLARIPPWRRGLSTNCSDKVWRGAANIGDTSNGARK